METGIWSISKNKYLTEEELKEFENLVMRDIKIARLPQHTQGNSSKITPEEKQELLANKHIWMYCLHSVRRELELQMSQYKLDKSEKQIELNSTTNPQLISELKEWLLVKGKWRVQAMKMLSIVEQKVVYLKTLTNQIAVKS